MMKGVTGYLIDEKKCEEGENESVSSEDLELLYGTLPMEHLPATPRRSNVSHEAKTSFPNSLLTPKIYSTGAIANDTLLGPELQPEDEDLTWV
jgi:hypothetical protein